MSEKRLSERKKKSSVLARQKPKKARKKPRKTYFKKTFVISCFLLLPFVIFGLYWSARQASRVFEDWLNQPVNWRISLNVESDSPLQPEVAAEILEIAAKELSSGNRRDMQRAAQEIQHFSSFERVHFVKLSPTEMVLHVKRRVPLMCIAAQGTRLLTRSGNIYGEAKNFGEGKSNCPGPIITGIFPAEVRLRKRQDQTLAISSEQQIIVDEAIELYLLLLPMNIQPSVIHHEKFRGFSVKSTLTPDASTEIALGRAPFTAKLAKLDTIRNNLVKKGEVAERVELDYQGKAFIKLKKM